MAHSRIIQLETSPIVNVNGLDPDLDIDEDSLITTISPDTYIYEYGVDHPIADYVTEDIHHDITINRFIERCQKVGPYVEIGNDDEEQWIIFREGFVYAFFEKLYPEFIKALDELVAKASPKAYCGEEIGTLLYSLEQSYVNRHECYIDSAGWGLSPFMEFVRRIEPNIKYYIGGTVDYHF